MLRKGEKHHFETQLSRFLSFSMSFATCLFTFGINRILDHIDDEYQMIIYETYTRNEIKVIPTSICCLQEEEEIVLVPGTVIKILSDFKEINLNYLYLLLQDEELSEWSWNYVHDFFKNYSSKVKFFNYKLEI